MAHKIILSGYYGFGNAGDEAVLAALCQILRERFGDELEIVALSAKRSQTASAYNIRAVDRWDKGALRRELAAASLFCSGGGSLLQDVTSVRSVWYYTSLIRLAQRCGVPTIVLAQGLGPLKTWAGRWLTKRALGRCRLLSWRDGDSLALAEQLGLGSDNQPNMLVCDPVLLWRPDVAANKDNNMKKRVGLALRPWPGFTAAQAARLAVLLREQGLEPVLIPFYQGEDEGGEDAKLALEINRILQDNVNNSNEKNDNEKNEPLAVLPCHNPWEAEQTIGGVDLLFGMRLHSLIMAAAQGVPALAVAYDPKVAAFAAAVGMASAEGGVRFAPEQAAEQLVRLAAAPAEYDTAGLSSRWEPLLDAIAGIMGKL